MNTTLWKLELMPHTNKAGKLDEMVLVTDISHKTIHNYVGLIHIDSLDYGSKIYERLEKGEAVQVKIVVVNEEG